jgi:hypothetical protein
MDAQLNDEHVQLAEYVRISQLLYEKTSAAMRKHQSPVTIVQETISKQRPANDESTATGRNAIEFKMNNNLWTDEVTGGESTMNMTTVDEQAVDNTSGQNVTVSEPLVIPLSAAIRTKRQSKSVVNSSSVVRQVYKCDHCEKEFTQSGARQRHLNEVHKNAREHGCQVCKKNFRRAYDLISCVRARGTRLGHFAKILNVAKLKLGNAHTGLIMHMRRHSGELKSAKSMEAKVECKICKRHYYASSLERHMIDIHFEQRSYACTICTKRFSRELYLKKHHTRHMANQRLRHRMIACAQLPLAEHS